MKETNTSEPSDDASILNSLDVKTEPNGPVQDKLGKQPVFVQAASGVEVA